MTLCFARTSRRVDGAQFFTEMRKGMRETDLGKISTFQILIYL